MALVFDLDKEGRKVPMAAKHSGGKPADNNATDPLSIIDVQVKEEFRIVIESNPATGYVWQPHYNEEALELVSSDFIAKNAAMGSGGFEIFRFIPKIVGLEKIQMLYKRPWERKPTRRTVYNIRVS